MKMSFAVPNGKCNLHDGIQSLNFLRSVIAGRVEGQAINPGSKGFTVRQQLVATSIIIGSRRRHEPPRSRGFLAFQTHGQILGGDSARGVENVR